MSVNFSISIKKRVIWLKQKNIGFAAKPSRNFTLTDLTAKFIYLNHLKNWCFYNLETTIKCRGILGCRTLTRSILENETRILHVKYKRFCNILDALTPVSCSGTFRCSIFDVIINTFQNGITVHIFISKFIKNNKYMTFISNTWYIKQHTYFKKCRGNSKFKNIYSCLSWFSLAAFKIIISHLTNHCFHLLKSSALLPETKSTIYTQRTNAFFLSKYFWKLL